MAVRKKKTERPPKKGHSRNQGHNGFVKEWLGDIQLARSFFQENLPQELTEGINWNELRKADSDFSMKALKNRQGDILFECKLFGDPAFLYIHLEHQRVPNKKMPIRMMIYQSGIWLQFQKQYPKKREPVILPIVFYHGKEAWNVEPDLHSYLKVSEKMKPFTPNFQYHLLDLSHLDDEAIKGELLLRVILLTMKHIDSPHLTDYFMEILFPMIRELLEKETGLEYIETILYYLTESNNKSFDTKAVVKKFEELPPSDPSKESVMSVIEYWKQEGRLEGIQKGIQKGKLEGIQATIWKQLQFKFAQKAEPYQTVLEKMSAAEIDNIGFKLLNATTIEQVFQDYENEQNK